MSCGLVLTGLPQLPVREHPPPLHQPVHGPAVAAADGGGRRPLRHTAPVLHGPASTPACQSTGARSLTGEVSLVISGQSLGPCGATGKVSLVISGESPDPCGLLIKVVRFNLSLLLLVDAQVWSHRWSLASL